MFPAYNYLLLDAARLGDRIDEAMLRNSQCESLYKGMSEASLSSVAPYLFGVKQHPDFAAWRLKAGWGDAWGVLIQAAIPMAQLHRHLRKFLLLKTEGGKELYFRFYDPRVLRIFLPTCDAEQLREFFGPIQYFLAEDEDPAYALRFSLANGVLLQERIPVKEYIDSLPEPAPFTGQPDVPAPQVPAVAILPQEPALAQPEARPEPQVTTHHFSPREEAPAAKKSKWMMFD